jgi:hypothetical protein
VLRKETVSKEIKEIYTTYTKLVFSMNFGDEFKELNIKIGGLQKPLHSIARRILMTRKLDPELSKTLGLINV